MEKDDEEEGEEESEEEEEEDIGPSRHRQRRIE